MGFLNNLFSRFRRNKKEVIEEETGEVREAPVLSRDSINLRDQGQRMRYVRSCLEQIRDAEREMELLTKEYGMVTAHLTDTEEIEALPPSERREISRIADHITAYEKEKHVYESGKDRMSDADFHLIERMEEEVEEAIDKLADAEDYQEKIRQDMRRLSGEKHAFQYRKHDLQNLMVNLRGMVIITSFSFITCMVILLLLQILMEMDIRIGYIFTAAATAIAVFMIYMKYTEAAKEKKQVERSINKLILLQNRVKIRYVNNTNLLDYLYMKYKVESAQELAGMWEMYHQEVEEREKFRELHAELDYQRQELLRILRRYQLKDPEVWVRQAQAISNRNEMVEIRHNLILRRQKPRKQMEYNEELARMAQGEIKNLAEEFPAYTPEIMELVSQYEEKG